MDQRAIEKAQLEFDRATESLNALKAANDFAAVERHWATFLVAANRVFTKLEQGTKTPARSYAWWGQKVHQRRKDPLLRYIHQARDSDEHTLGEVTARNFGGVKSVPPTEEEFETLRCKMEEGHPGQNYAPLAMLEVVFPHVEVIEVVNKGVRFEPPSAHLGTPITDFTPAYVGTLAHTFLEKMILEARNLAAD